MGSWLVDGMNVMGSRPDGWWRDRPAARRRLVGELEAFSESSGDQVAVVFDGRAVAEEVADARAVGIELVFAPGGPNAADDVIVELVTAAPAPPVVVTSDRALAERVRTAGGTVEGVSAFRRRLGTT